jgi:predicted RND superfamily exporter protein
LDGLSEYIGRSPVVARVLSPLDLLRKLRHWESGFDPEDYRLPESASEAESLIVGLDERGSGLAEGLVSGDGRTVRLSAIVDEMDEAEFLELVRDTGAAVTELPDGFKGFVTGMVLRLVNAQQRLVASQLKSLGLAFGVIFAAIWIGLRSWRLTAVSILPNVLPVLATFAGMSVLSIPLDAATIMVASVALGIAVDNTVHLLTGYERARRRGAAPVAAVGETLDRVGSALVITSLTACVGFGSLCVSAFIPIRYFGVLAAISLIVALAADLLVVPAMMVVRGSR